MRAVARLRGIKVGGGKRLAMADLRQLAETFGWRDVSPILATGNVLFTLPRDTVAQAGEKLQKGLRAELGLDTGVVVLTAADVRAVLDEMPFGAMADNPSRLLAGAFITPAARTALAPLAARDWSPGAFALGTRAAYLWCPDGILASPLVEAVARAARDGLTSRNFATWRKVGTGVFSAETR